MTGTSKTVVFLSYIPIDDEKPSKYEKTGQLRMLEVPLHTLRCINYTEYHDGATQVQIGLHNNYTKCSDNEKKVHGYLVRAGSEWTIFDPRDYGIIDLEKQKMRCNDFIESVFLFSLETQKKYDVFFNAVRWGDTYGDCYDLHNRYFHR